MPEKTGTFLVTAADPDRAVLSDVTDRQVHTLESHPDLADGEVLEATIASIPPLHAVWRVESVAERRHVEVAVTDERPTTTSREIAAELAEGDLHTRERADVGAIHVLRVPSGRAEEAAREVASDRETTARAARLGARRVEIRTAADVLTVRYLP